MSWQRLSGYTYWRHNNFWGRKTQTRQWTRRRKE